MQASRLLSILMLLQGKTQVTAVALAQALEVSVRTIQRDIDQLSAAGVPVWVERGRSGGIRLQAGWTTNLNGLTEAEGMALALAGLPGPATQLGIANEASTAQRKVFAGLPEEWRAQAHSVTERLHVDPIDWYRTTETPTFLKAIAEAVWAGRCIRVDYEGWQHRSTKDLAPLGLVLKAGTWYLVAASTRSQAIGTYRLANILAVERTKGIVRRPTRFDLPSYWRASLERFERERFGITATLRLSPRGQALLANLRFPNQRQTDPADNSGWQCFSVPIESCEHGARTLMALGGEFEVLGPEELRDAVKQLATDVLRQQDARSTRAPWSGRAPKVNPVPARPASESPETASDCSATEPEVVPTASRKRR